jgi:hypothetical protein
MWNVSFSGVDVTQAGLADRAELRERRWDVPGREG